MRHRFAALGICLSLCASLARAEEATAPPSPAARPTSVWFPNRAVLIVAADEESAAPATDFPAVLPMPAMPGAHPPVVSRLHSEPRYKIATYASPAEFAPPRCAEAACPSAALPAPLGVESPAVVEYPGQVVAYAAPQPVFDANSDDPANRAAHLSRAITELKAGGLDDEALRLQTRLDADVLQLLDRLKTAEAKLAKVRSPNQSKQQILLKVKLLEVNWGFVRRIGLDMAPIQGSRPTVGTCADLFKGGVRDPEDARQMESSVNYLRENDLVKVLAQPNLVTRSGLQVFYNSGGEFPVNNWQSSGAPSVDFKKYGTQIDCRATVLEEGRIRIEFRPRISELDNSRSLEVNGIKMPALKVSFETDVAADLKPGQLLVLKSNEYSKVVQRPAPKQKDGKPAPNATRPSDDTVNCVLVMTVQPILIDR